jgi:poly-gamma-glutamate synthesis protein (capsule biosynthesis protein)
MRIVLQGGDNMLGRAIQLTLPYQTPGDDQIRDSMMAKDYLNLVNIGNINKIRRQNVNGNYLWQDLLKLDFEEDVRIINIESACTYTIYASDIPKKPIIYHTHLDNIDAIFAEFNRPYIFTMANNHALDMGLKAFTDETLPNIKNTVGIGINQYQAFAPLMIGNILIFGFGTECSGIPREWEATNYKPGIALLPPITSDANVKLAFERILNHTQNYDTNGKCIIITIHWGPNWAHTNDGQEFRRKLAYELIDNLDVSIIHGHSSHHIRGIEKYKNKLIIYGAGDFVNDYEVITGNSNYDKAGALYIVDLKPQEDSYHLSNLQVIPFEMEKLSCKQITDPQRLYQVFTFINSMSSIDCKYPLYLNITN